MRAWLALLLLAPGLPALSGCIECSPEGVDATVALEPVSLQVRTLPVLSSGATEVAGITVPDSHARLEFQVAVDGVPRVVDVQDLRLGLRVDGESVPGRVTRVESGGTWVAQGDAWSGSLRDDGSLVLWWTVDHDRAGLDAVVLGEGAEAEAELSFSWSVDDCTYRADGTIRHRETLPVAASLVTSTFEQAGEPSLDPGTIAGARFQVDLRVKNGVTTRIEGGRAVAVLLSSGGPPGAAAWPSVATFVGPLPADTVAPGETLTVREETPAPWVGGREGLAILVLHLRHEATDGTGGVHEDVLGFAVET